MHAADGDVSLLLVQLAALAGVARLFSEVARRLDQPAVIGELLAGIALGPSVFGTLAPGAFAVVFPARAELMRPLAAISWIGMVLLLLLTGLETDVRAMRAIGRPALFASLLGLAVPFAGGYLLGLSLPDAMLAQPERRSIFAAFLALSMTISAMAVVAKILLDLDLLKRDVGLVTLSASVLDDTLGWVLLSMISAVATSGVIYPSMIVRVVGLTALLIAGSYLVVFPLAKMALKRVDDLQMLAGTDLTFVVVMTFGMAALAEGIGAHAAFGAFLSGVVLRQAPRLRQRSVHALATVVQAVFSPIFFAFVGLRVELHAVSGPGLLLAVVGVAISTKIAGCTLGARLGGLGAWESVAVGVGMSARGSQELVLALIGLQLGIFNAEMYAVIVIMAASSALLAPVLLRFTAKRLDVTEDERRRIDSDRERIHIAKDRIKILVPIDSGADAARALAIAAPLARREGSTLTALRVETPADSGSGLIRAWLRGRRRVIDETAAALDGVARAYVRTLADAWSVAIDERHVLAPTSAEGIVREAERGFDLVVLGASEAPDARRRSVIDEISRQTSCHVVFVKSKDRERPRAYQEILVPTDGSYCAQVAFEFAAAYAEEVGARVTLLHVIASHAVRLGAIPALAEVDVAQVNEIRATLTAAIEPVLRRFRVAAEVRVAAGDFVNSTIVREAARGRHDLLVIGAETRAVLDHFFLGHGTEYVIEEAPCTVATVLPAGMSGSRTSRRSGLSRPVGS